MPRELSNKLARYALLLGYYFPTFVKLVVLDTEL